LVLFSGMESLMYLSDAWITCAIDRSINPLIRPSVDGQ
jgi:hypothetical protein